MNSTNFFSLRLLLPLFLVFASCGDNYEDIQAKKIDNDPLILMAMELFTELDESLPNQELALRINLDETGKGNVHFSAKDNISSEIHDFKGAKVSSLAEEEGAECSTAIGCLKEAKKCLDDGQDAVISNGPCATYCVTCQEPE